MRLLLDLHSPDHQKFARLGYFKSLGNLAELRRDRPRRAGFVIGVAMHALMNAIKCCLTETVIETGGDMFIRRYMATQPPLLLRVGHQILQMADYLVYSFGQAKQAQWVTGATLEYALEQRQCEQGRGDSRSGAVLVNSPC